MIFSRSHVLANPYSRLALWGLLTVGPLVGRLWLRID
jgi:hypothetical protein